MDYSVLSHSSVCKFKVLQEATECSNRSCSTVLEGGAESFSVEPMYDVRVSLSDYTGSVDGVRLYGQQAVELLGVMVCVCVYVCVRACVHVCMCVLVYHLYIACILLALSLAFRIPVHVRLT